MAEADKPDWDAKEHEALRGLPEVYQEALIQAQALHILHLHQIRILRQDLQGLAQALGVTHLDGCSFEVAFQDRVNASVDRFLSKMADDDPKLAAALRKALEQQQVIGPVEEEGPFS